MPLWLRVLSFFTWFYLMMAVHELGHVVGCLFSGAQIHAVILWPWTISQTQRSGSQVPLLDTWAGPLLGMLLPLLLWLGCRRWPHTSSWLGGWAGFCLIANGLYLAYGWLDEAGDAGDLLHLGTPIWLLIVVGIIATAAGLWLWHVLLQRARDATMRREFPN